MSRKGTFLGGDEGRVLVGFKGDGKRFAHDEKRFAHS